MLIYNHNKEFIGVDEGLLQTLGFQSLDDLKNESEDFADLFVKKPGYIHNFQNFQWIDFILHSESDTAKAIIQAKGKGFETEIVIKPFYLAADPENEAYLISLEHIKALGILDEDAFAAAAAAAPAVEEAPPAPPATPAPAPEAPVAQETFAAPETPPTPPEKVTMDMPEMDIAMDTIPEPESETALPDFSAPLEIEEDLFMPEEKSSEVELPPMPEMEIETAAPEAKAPSAPATEEAAGDYFSAEEAEIISTLQTPHDYIYNPQVASDELGLPVDLIEEFIGDFIGQAHEFHDEIFNAARTSDFENVQILSHKLKGVAANLRVEDALEVLTNINMSKDVTVIEANLKQFYKIIAKLEGKELPGTTVASAAPTVPTAGVLPPDETFDLNAPEPELKEESFTAPVTEEAPAEEELYNFDMPPMDEPEVEMPGETVLPDVTPAPSPATEAILYDADKAANELGIDQALVRELVNDFVDQANEIRHEFDAAVDNGQHTKWQNSALQLKGITDNLRMHEVSAELTALIDTQDPETARLAVEQLYSNLNTLHT